MAKEGIEEQITPREWAEIQAARTAEALGGAIDYWKGLPRGARLKLAASFLVPATLGTVSAVSIWRFREGRIEPPTVPPAEGKETTLDVSQAQIPPQPKIAVPTEAEEAPEYFERVSPTQDFFVQIQAPEPIEPIIPSEKPPEAEAATEVEAVTYKIQSGDTLIGIAKKFNLSWQILYGKNITEIGYNPNEIKAGDKLIIPDGERDKELVEKLNPQKISEGEFPSIDLLTRQDPEKLKELRWRAVAVVAYDINERHIFFEDWREFRDFRIFDFWGNYIEKEELNYPNVLETLAWHEIEFERNPAIEQVLEEMSPGVKVMNKILMDKASPEWFKDGKIPQLPEDLRGRFVFKGGIPPGLGWPYYPSINLLGDYSYEMVKQRLPYTSFHELIHSILQFESIIKAHPWVEQPEENKQNLLKPENISAHLGHKAMDILTLPAMEAIGRSPTKYDSRILYIYWVLKREGVADPYKEILSAAVSMNADRLWQVYKEVCLPSDYSIDELFTRQEGGPEGYYESFDQEKALEELRAEYLPYLSE